MNFTAIDFETANARRGSACEVGLVVVENGKIVNRLSQLIRPEPLHFDPRNIAVHGIYPEDVRDAPTFFEAWTELWPKISGPLIAHNAAFDMSVLRYSFDDAGARYPETDYFCTVVMSRLAWPDFPNYKLNSVARELGVSFNHHDAEEDAFACAKIAMAACESLGVSSLYDLPDRHGLRIGRLHADGYCPCGGPRQTYNKSKSRNKLKASDISATAIPNKQHIFYGKAFVFTGTMSCMLRKEAMQAVVDRGGICHDSLKAKSNYLVIGQEGFVGYKSGFKSSKIEKAEMMKSKGRPIEILSEEGFIRMLEEFNNG